MSRYRVTVHLSTDFRRTTDLAYGFPTESGDDDSFSRAAIDGVYDGYGFTFNVETSTHQAAAEVTWAVCNSYPDELHCQQRYAEDVLAYRDAGNRSLSMGDMVVIFDRDHTTHGDGRYIVARAGFTYLEGANA